MIEGLWKIYLFGLVCIRKYDWRTGFKIKYISEIGSDIGV